jgi:ABC-type multidrug transport system fused ATPase/permease subunit
VLWLLPPVIVGVVSAKALAQYGQAVAVQSVVLRVIEGLQAALFRALTRADLATIARDAPARHSTRFTVDAAAIREALTKSINGGADVLTIIGLVASMVWLDWRMSLVAVLLYPIAVVPILRLGKRIRRASGGMQERMGETAAALTESFAAARLVRAYRLEEQEEARAAAAFAGLRASLFKIARIRASLDPVLEVLGGLAVAAVLLFVGWRVSSGQGTLGEFTGFVAAVLIAARPVRSLGSLNAALQQGLAGLAGVFAAIDAPRRVVDAPDAAPLPAGEGLVEFDAVGFRYEGTADKALHGLSFSARPGETVALVGPSGGGKSTALALVPRLYDATAGAVRVDGADVRGVAWPPCATRSPTSRRTRCCSTTRLPPTSLAAGQAPRGPKWKRRRARPRRTASSPRCRRATKRRSAPAATACPAGNGSASPSPARCCGTRACCCSTRRRARWTRRTKRRCSRPWPPCGRAARRSSSRTACPPCARPTASWWWTPAAPWNRAAHAELMAAGGLYARLVRTQAFAAEPVPAA